MLIFFSYVLVNLFNLKQNAIKAFTFLQWTYSRRQKIYILRFERLKLRWLCDFGSVPTCEIPGPRLSLYLPLGWQGRVLREQRGMVKACQGRGGPGLQRGPGSQSLGHCSLLQ